MTPRLRKVTVKKTSSNGWVVMIEGSVFKDRLEKREVPFAKIRAEEYAATLPLVYE